MRRLRLNPEPVDHPLARSRLQSPLRYPGAKSRLIPAISTLVTNAATHRSVRTVDLFVEPFAGGASVSLALLGAGLVERVLLADVDPLVASFWQETAARPEDLIDRIADEHRRYVARGGALAVDRWDHWRTWTPKPGASKASVRADLAVRCMFLNRTTFSGILHGQAGPIGGRAQTSNDRIGCRWNQDGLAERVRYVGHLYETGRIVDVWCCDWSDTLASVPEHYPGLIPSRVVAYLDPPYFAKSRKLYRQSFDPSGGYARDANDLARWRSLLAHERLAKHLRTKMQFRWLLSYDADPTLTRHRSLYGVHRMNPSVADKQMLGVREWTISKRLVTLRYTASARQRGEADELLLTTFPASTVPLDDTFRGLRPPRPVARRSRPGEDGAGGAARRSGA